VDIHSALLSFSKLASQDLPDMTIIPITEAEIICTFTSLKNNSSGYDSVSYRILKFCGKFCGKPTAHISNKLLVIVLDHLKYSVINPLFKKKKSELTNYRLISLLNGFSKIFKLFIYQRLNQPFQNHSIFASEQYGICITI